ncbi:hypothetical protein PRUPE_5G204200 [Prunus persica]|uniref:AIPP2-like SPOC-like domain-containing protein n=1 Tax=Prunus persica TaxID=3760 RepID=A0A251PB96_PRUPE|nr:hypothetical protein PRUPE_5G204200 [Prunus persica]
MEQPEETHMVGQCDVCGGITDENLIATCIKCNISTEHSYCMRILPMEFRDGWVCESCEVISPKADEEEGIMASCSDLVHHDVMHPAGPSRVLDDSGWQAHSRRQKPVETGKVKFIANEEVIRLSSAVRSQRSTFSSKPRQLNFMAPIPQRTPFGSRILTPKFPMSAIKANSSIMPSRTVNPSRCGGSVKMQSIAKIIQQTSPIFKDSKVIGETKTSVASGNEHIGEKQLTDVLVGETSYKKMESKTGKEPLTISTMRQSSPISSPDSEERDLVNIFDSLNLKPSNLPARDAPWKGGFILDAATPGEFIGGFQARPPCKVHPKAYAFSQKMPLILNANWLPRSSIWTTIFQDDDPVLEDVALYIFPDENIERSRENHARLINRMENQDSMMRICFDGKGVELLIFTSASLQLDSRVADFLWGIFRCIKKDVAHNKVHEGLPSTVDQENVDDNKTLDMEVDMVGGKMVGRVDIVVPRDSKVIWNTKSSSEMKTTCGLQKNLGKDEGKIPPETLEEEESAGPPGFS